MTNTPESKTEVTSDQYLQALNRTYSVLAVFDSLILGHSVLHRDYELRQKVKKTRDGIWELYQSLSAKHDSARASEETKP